MQTYYLVDYENVNGDGLAGCEKLDNSSHIIIFFTANARKIDMCDIANHGSASLEMIEIPAGKQSTDIHIGSYVGFLVGCNQSNDMRVVVISRDTDFDNVLSFWQGKRGIKTYRAKKISGPLLKPVVTDPSAVPKKPAKASASKKPVISGERKKAVNSDIMRVLNKAGYPTDVVGYTASTVAKFLGEKTGKQSTYRTIISKYGQQKGLEIYRHIKEIL